MFRVLCFLYKRELRTCRHNCLIFNWECINKATKLNMKKQVLKGMETLCVVLICVWSSFCYSCMYSAVNIYTILYEYICIFIYFYFLKILTLGKTRTTFLVVVTIHLRHNFESEHFVSEFRHLWCVSMKITRHHSSYVTCLFEYSVSYFSVHFSFDTAYIPLKHSDL